MKNKTLIGITSPPYEESLHKTGQKVDEIDSWCGNLTTNGRKGFFENDNYSKSKNNIGNLKHQPQELDFDITQYHKCGGELYWKGCYGSETYYKQFVTPESYAHPAKISFLLTERIFKHLEHLGLLKEGMTIVDFMCGSGRINLLASLRGYDSVGVELENHFIKMCEDNKKFAENKIGRKLNFEIMQGDSRQLSKILNKGDVGILSPPYGLGEGIGHSGQPTQVVKDLNLQTRYGSSEGNIGNLPYKEMVGVVSPPYQDSLNNGLKEEDREKYQEWKRASKSYGENYSQNPQNIGNLKDKPIVGITSPPYADGYTIKEGGQVNEEYVERRKEALIKQGRKEIADNLKVFEYNTSNPENISNLKDKELVGITSPPYDNRLSDGGKDGDKWEQWHKLAIEKRETATKYTDNIENIGNQNNQSYLSAMLRVYQEAYKSGMQVLVTITKNPTRAGKLRRLDLDTAKLIEMSGFKIVDYHRSILYRTYEQNTLSGGKRKEYKGRLSFFKRLSLQKGNQASMWEDILIAVRR